MRFFLILIALTFVGAHVIEAQGVSPSASFFCGFMVPTLAHLIEALFIVINHNPNDETNTEN